jgi:hypothetical protein
LAQPLRYKSTRGGIPRKEVGTMGYLVIGIAYIVLAVVAVVKPGEGHA